MNTLERLAIEYECTRALHEYTRLVDYVDPLKAARMITDDGSLVLENRSQTLSGRKEMDAMYKQQSEGMLAGKMLWRHFLSTLIVDVKDSDHATSEATVLLFRSAWDTSKGPCPNIAPEIFQWRDEYVRTPDGWRISKHVVTPFAFKSPEAQFATNPYKP
ncbi:nuclear transport factor 2 family protein [Bradyrhizobium zhanjiangense]|nr:nuclear transport factor 2 family protein [Bradyrhizobium zhanjiangense]